jgi:DNA-binding MarR family transcriptional regulator
VQDDETVNRLRMVVLRLSRRLRQQVHSGITPSQLSALAMVDRHGPLTLGDLANLENVQPPSISRIVGALEGEGWVERTADERDRRVSLVQTTAAGRRELRQIRSERSAWLRRRLDSLDEADRRCLAVALPALERLLEDEGSEPR